MSPTTATLHLTPAESPGADCVPPAAASPPQANGAEPASPQAPQAAPAATPTDAARPAEQDTVVDYDWSVPRRFIPAEREQLQAFAAAAAKRVAADLAAFLRLELAMEAGPVTEHYGADAWNPQSFPAYPVPLSDKEGRPCGMLAIPPAVATGWVEHLLGGKAPVNAAMRTLTALESALLLDIAAVMTKALATASSAAGGPVFQHVERVAVDPSPMAGHESEECCRFTLTAVTGKDRAEIVVVLAGDSVAAIANPESVNRKPRPAEEIRKDMLGHLAGITASVTVRLGTATVTMRDVVGLEVGDVLLLNRTVGEPIEMLVKETVAHHGLPVACEGAYAFRILDQRLWPRLATTKGDDQP